MKYKYFLEKLFNNQLETVEIVPLMQDDSMTNRIQAGNGTVYKYNIEFADGKKTSFIGKKKSVIIILNGARMIAGNNISLIMKICRHSKIFGYQKSWKREAFIYSRMPSDLNKYLPYMQGFCAKKMLKSCFLVMNEFPHRLIESKADIYRCIDAISSIHNRFYNKTSIIKELCLNHYSCSDYKKAKRLFKTLFNRLTDENVKLFGEDKVIIINNFIDCMDEEYKKVSFHQTLSHNDFSDRNISVTDDKIIIYDWELAGFQNPEHDVVEFVLSVMDYLNADEIGEIFKYHRNCLETDISDETHRLLLRFNLLEYCVNKLTLLRYAEKYLNLDYTKRIVKNVTVLMDLLNIKE